MAKAKQDWSEGATVKVGFMTLIVVRKIPTPGDFMPDAYVLRNVAGTQAYKFTPHNGIQKIEDNEAQELIYSADHYIGLLARRAIAAAANRPAWFR